MKRTMLPVTLFVTAAALLFGCSKTGPVSPAPTPGQSATMGAVTFHIAADLAGQPYHSSNLQAVITIAAASGEEVVKEKVVSLNIANPVQTAPMELPAGDYRITALRLVYGGANTHFAAPATGSLKAASVTKPLAISFKVEGGKAMNVPVEVLRVQTGETPQQYGYAAGAFDNNQSESSLYLKVKMKAVIQVGDVTYDSIPALLKLTTWSTNGEINTTHIPMNAGINEVQLLKAATRYEFTVTKWGVSDVITLSRQNVDENTVYMMGGNKVPKLLKSERTYRMVNGTDVADTKTDYFYGNGAKLEKIEYWTKKADNSNLLSLTDHFVYNGPLLEKINRTDMVTNSLVKETAFTYNFQQKITGIRETDGGFLTTATVSYLPSQQQWSIDYYYASGHTMQYTMFFDKGNVISSAAGSSKPTSEMGNYSYDTNINPYRQMNWPNLFLSHNSKNNVTNQTKQYTGAFPANDLYNMEYKYDADGYPIEVIKHYRQYPSGNYAFATKTVFVY